MQTLFLISGDSMLKTCPYRLLSTSRNTGHFLLLSITKHASRADGQVNKNGTLEMRNSLTKSAFLGKRVHNDSVSLIKNYWEKDKRSIVLSRQLTHLPKCVSSHDLPSNFISVHPENFIQFDHHHLTVYLYSVFCRFSKKRQNIRLTYKKTNITVIYYI